MTDLATLGLAIDSRPAVEAGAALDKFAASGARAETAARGVEAATTRMGRAANENAAALANAQRGLSGVTGMLEQSIAAHVRAEAAMGRWRKATNDVADTTKLAAYQVQNLRAQFLDVAVSLQGGMNPLTVLLQQGPQIAQVFGPGTGVTGVIRGVGREIATIGTSAFGITAGVVAAAATVAGAFNTWDTSQKAVAVGLTGLGRQSGLTATQIELIAQSSDLSISRARDLATAFAATGNASVETITKAQARTKDFATTLGVSLDDAGKVQLEFFQNAGESYDKYATRLGVYSASTSRLINDLTRQGRGAEAVRVAFDQVNSGLARYNELAPLSTRATDYLRESFSNLWQGLSSGTGNAAQALARSLGSSVGITDTTSASRAAQAGELARMRAAQERAEAVRIGIARDNELLKVDPVRREVIQAQEQAGVKERPLTDAERFSYVFGQASNPNIGSYRKEVIDRPNTNYYGRPLSSVVDRAERAMISSKEELAVGIERERLATTDIAQSRALDDVQRQAARSQEAQAAAMGKTAGEAERLTTRAGLLNRATADGIPLSAENARRIDEVSAAYGRQAQAIAEAGLRREIAFQREQLGRTPGEAAIAAQLRGVYGDDLSSSGARAAAEQLRLNDEIRTTQAAYSSLAQMGSGLIDPLLDKTRSWSDAFSDLARNIARAALQAAIFGQGPLSGLFGTQGAGAGPGGLVGSLIGSVGGNPFSRLFGGGGSVSDIGTTDGPGIWFANGGIMTSRGQVPLHRYATGGIATSPQVAIFGEGRGPEAYVPLPDGRRIPVAMQQPANSNAAGGFTDARSFSFDMRGSTLTEAQARAAFMQALAINNRERDRTMGERFEAWRLGAA